MATPEEILAAHYAAFPHVAEQLKVGAGKSKQSPAAATTEKTGGALPAAVVTDVERIVCEIPFTERQARITEREVYTWNVVELCKVTLSTGEVGWGETVL